MVKERGRYRKVIKRWKALSSTFFWAAARCHSNSSHLWYFFQLLSCWWGGTESHNLFTQQGILLASQSVAGVRLRETQLELDQHGWPREKAELPGGEVKAAGRWRLPEGGGRLSARVSQELGSQLPCWQIITVGQQPSEEIPQRSSDLINSIWHPDYKIGSFQQQWQFSKGSCWLQWTPHTALFARASNDLFLSTGPENTVLNRKWEERQICE